MIALDSNVLIRFITQDDKPQFMLAKSLITQFQGYNRSVYLNNITLCELCWVLRSGYKYSKQQVLEVLKKIINIEEFAFQDLDVVAEAVVLYENGKADFADYLIYLLNKTAGYVETYSFDQKSIDEKLFKFPHSAKI